MVETYSKSGQNKKEVNKQTPFIPVHSLADTFHKKKLVNAREHSFPKKEMHQFPPTSHGATARSEFHVHGHAILGRTSLDERSARRRGLYLASHNTHKRHIHAPSGIHTRNPNKREVADIYLNVRPLGSAEMRQNENNTNLEEFKIALNVSFLNHSFTVFIVLV
jgi:hypothetical protein